MHDLATHLAMQLERIRLATGITAQMDGEQLIAFTKSIAGGQHTQAELARESGLMPNTITALAHGKKPTAAQRAAIKWAIAKALGL